MWRYLEQSLKETVFQGFFNDFFKNIDISCSVIHFMFLTLALFSNIVSWEHNRWWYDCSPVIYMVYTDVIIYIEWNVSLNCFHLNICEMFHSSISHSTSRGLLLAANIYLFKINDKNTRNRLEQCRWRFQVSLLLTLKIF